MAELICVEDKCLLDENGNPVFCLKCEDENLHKGHNYLLCDKAINKIIRILSEGNAEETILLKDIDQIIAEWYKEVK